MLGELTPESADVIRHRQSFAGLMPAGAIEHQYGVSTGCHLRADFTEMFGHTSLLTAGMMMAAPKQRCGQTAPNR